MFSAQMMMLGHLQRMQPSLYLYLDQQYHKVLHIFTYQHYHLHHRHPRLQNITSHCFQSY